jgi:DDE superfamily endonuclease
MYGKIVGMITWENLRRCPAAFKSLTGFTPEAFESLFLAFARGYEERRYAAPTTKRGAQPRQRAVGAGHPFTHDLPTRLLMTLIWLRIYPTFEVLGFLFSLNKTNVHDTVREMLATLETMANFSFERPAAERKKLRSVQAVMDAFPAVRLVIDTKEQPIQRPKSTKENDRQKPYYSGKKKRHTIKSEIGVEPDGQIGAVSASVPGGATADLSLLRKTRLVERLDADEAAMLDRAYVGAKKEFPGHQLWVPHKASRGHPLTEAQKAENRRLAQYRIVVEHTNAQLNQFQVLAQVYRHARESHTQAVRVVAMLVNRRIRERPLKSYPIN